MLKPVSLLSHTFHFRPKGEFDALSLFTRLVDLRAWRSEAKRSEEKRTYLKGRKEEGKCGWIGGASDKSERCRGTRT